MRRARPSTRPPSCSVSATRADRSLRRWPSAVAPARSAFRGPLTERPGLDFSFSGLKTAVVVALRDRELDDQTRADAALAFEDAVAETLAIKCERALEQTGAQTLVVAGGVGANRRLRARLLALGSQARGARGLPAAGVLHGQRGDDRACSAACVWAPVNTMTSKSARVHAGRCRSSLRRPRATLGLIHLNSAKRGIHGHHLPERSHDRMHHRHLGLGTPGQAEGRRRSRDGEPTSVARPRATGSTTRSITSVSRSACCSSSAIPSSSWSRH